MKKIAIALLIGLGISCAWAAHHVTYPSGFRNWHHVKSMVINPGHALYESVGGIHHIYANAKAMQGYKSGKFPNGAVIVFDLFEAKDADNAISEGARKAVIVMARDKKKYKDTGGWGFEVFPGDTRKGSLDAKAAQACFQCHTQVTDKEYVFSALRD